MAKEEQSSVSARDAALTPSEQSGWILEMLARYKLQVRVEDGSIRSGWTCCDGLWPCWFGPGTLMVCGHYGFCLVEPGRLFQLLLCEESR